MFHHGGEFRVEVPPGKLSLHVVKGFEYWPKREEVEIRAGEVSRITVPLEPMTDMAAKGWYGGSTHVHMNYAGNLQNRLENLMMMSEAEDQDIVNEQIAKAAIHGVSDPRRQGGEVDRLDEVLGKRGVTADTALRLAQRFRTSPQFWRHLQAAWDLHQAMRKISAA